MVLGARLEDPADDPLPKDSDDPRVTAVGKTFDFLILWIPTHANLKFFIIMGTSLRCCCLAQR